MLVPHNEAVNCDLRLTPKGKTLGRSASSAVQQTVGICAEQKKKVGFCGILLVATTPE